MNAADLARADLLYSIARNAQVRRRKVTHHGLGALSVDIRRLYSALREERDDPYWEDVLRFMRVFMFAVSGTPLPFNYPALGLGSLLDRLLDRIQAIEAVYPAFAVHVRETIDQMIVIARSADDPLGDAVRSELAGSRGDDILVLLRRAARVAAVRERLARSLGSGLQVATTHLLSHENVYGRIVAIGPSRWFTEALAAPRAPQVDLFRYSWIRDQPVPPALFTGSRSRGRLLHAGMPSAGGESDAEVLPEALFEPRVAWSQIHESVLKAAWEEDEAGEEIEARLFLLADSYGVYVEAEEGARSYVLNPAADFDDRVQLLPADELTPGMVLILRTEGGDDRTALANRILGGHASMLRERQGMWKERLRQELRRIGPTEVVRRLRDQGSARASRANLRNWASTRSKRTRDYEDFLAIMRVVGLVSEATKLWEDMGVIVSAHRQAGQQVRAVLIRRMEKADLTRLEAEGRLDFEAPDLGGGMLTAFRVEEVSPEARLIPENRVDRPFRLEVELWHG